MNISYLILVVVLLSSLLPISYAQEDTTTTTTDDDIVDIVEDAVNDAIDEVEDIITVCSQENIDKCATTANRTCYNFEEQGTHECGYCLLDFIEYEDECYAIADIGVDGFFLLSKAIELFLPEYADQDVTTAQRAVRLIASASVISFWNSQVPPPQFFLSLGNETLLTPEEKEGRAGIDSTITYDDSGPRGELPRMFDDDGLERNLRRFERKLDDEVPSKKDWDKEGYTTAIKNQGK